MQINPLGRNWGSVVNWDDLGKLYAGLIIAWSACLLAGILCLIWYRRSPFVRIRNLPIAITSTFFLHIYLVKIFLAYTTNGHFLCSAEFWIMSIYLPFGIALFQANITQLRSISEQQDALLYRETTQNRTPELAPQGRLSGLYRRFCRLTQAQRSYVFIVTGMIIQLIITSAIYATSPTLQGDWSSYGELPYNKGQVKCRKTWEWIPSAFWQLFWTWIYGPYELFTIRHIRDAHRWRLQTILCIVSGLPGSPLWIAAVFSVAFKPVNPWFVPPMWLAPGIIVMQFATIFFPIFEVFEHYSSTHKRISSYSSSESTLRSNSVISDKVGRTLSRNSTSELFDDINAISAGRLYSMLALERALVVNPSPLLHYAAKQDFTAENIIFLTQVRDWRQTWNSAPRNPSTDMVTEDAQVRLFRMAVEIFATSVDEKTADFPINIDSHMRKSLACIFSPAVLNALSGFAGRNGSTGTEASNRLAPVMSPWADTKQTSTITTTVSASLRPSTPRPTLHSMSSAETAVSKTVTISESKPYRLEDRPDLSPLSNGRGIDIPGFNEHVFDEAESSIKYLVLTNTWRKFVQMRERDQEEYMGF
ncbi:hypothetical protein Q7P37_005328 [Cladosporium fusiforme]